MKKTIKFVVVFFVSIILTGLIVGGGWGPKSMDLITDSNTIVFAHRGIAVNNVENSIEAFEKAIKSGFNAIETDVLSTKDGKLIIFHDESASRLLNLDQNISDLNWDEIKNGNLHFQGNETHNKVLSLEQYLEYINDSIITYLDIKTFSKSIADSLLNILSKYDHQKIIIADSDIKYLTYLKIKNSNLKVVLEGFDKGKEWLYYIIPKKMKPDYYASYLDRVDENHMEFLVGNNLLNRKIVYGVNHSNISDAYDFGLTNIIYDFDSTTSNLQQIRFNLAKHAKD